MAKDPNNHFVVIYRDGVSSASNACYTARIDQACTPEESAALHLEFVKRYNSLTLERAEKLNEETRKYRGPQPGLATRLQEVLDEKK